MIGLIKSDPRFHAAALSLTHHGAGLSGNSVPVLDFNDGWQTQALGHLAASDWLHFVVPWWNPYSGIGLPLAAEYQPGGFFPLTLLLLLPNGVALEHMCLQIVASTGTFLLLRGLGTGRLAATVAGLLFAFSGTLAWFHHAPSLPIAFLPWQLVAVERIAAGARFGWGWLAISMGLGIAAAFPEVAYIDGLLVFCWAVLRLAQAAPAQRPVLICQLVGGGLAALALNAPQLLSFFEFLGIADIDGHRAAFAHLSLPLIAIVPMFVAPYAFGPLHAYLFAWPKLFVIAGTTAGFVGLSTIGAACIGLSRRSRGIEWLLLAWIAVTLAKSFGLPLVTDLLNLVPGVPQSAFLVYACPSWEFAFAVLAGFGVEQVRQGRVPRYLWLSTVVVGTLLFSSAIAVGVHERTPLTEPGLNVWYIVCLIWAISVFGLFLWTARQGRLRLMVVLLVGDAMILADLPALANPTRATLDLPAVEFLKSHLGLNRFYTLGPIAPNYGAFFRIASINYNYLPAPQVWTTWVPSHLDSQANTIIFDGTPGPRHASMPTPLQELQRNLANYRWLGVEYVVVPKWLHAQPDSRLVRRYQDRMLSIYEVPDPAPYFEVIGGDCAGPAPLSRTDVRLSCRTPATLLRRELFFPGWSAEVNGRPAPVQPYAELFQAVSVPAGESTVRFTYAPPNILWAWAALAVAALALLWDGLRAIRAGAGRIRPLRGGAGDGRVRAE
ncbi:MAG TPA: hypothetical protein VFA03_16590 [Acetobacteraceae bacterium]|nr:hypothetical protein [Acetobacteraceae bacterium]